MGLWGGAGRVQLGTVGRLAEARNNLALSDSGPFCATRPARKLDCQVVQLWRACRPVMFRNGHDGRSIGVPSPGIGRASGCLAPIANPKYHQGKHMSIVNATARSSDMLKLVKSEQGGAASNLAVAGFTGMLAVTSGGKANVPPRWPRGPHGP